MLNNIGNWRLSVIETGRFWLDGGAMMGSVPKVLWEKTNTPDEKNRIELALRCLLLDNGDKWEAQLAANLAADAPYR